MVRHKRNFFGMRKQLHRFWLVIFGMRRWSDKKEISFYVSNSTILFIVLRSNYVSAYFLPYGSCRTSNPKAYEKYPLVPILLFYVGWSARLQLSHNIFENKKNKAPRKGRKGCRHFHFSKNITTKKQWPKLKAKKGFREHLTVKMRDAVVVIQLWLYLLGGVQHRMVVWAAEATKKPVRPVKKRSGFLLNIPSKVITFVREINNKMRKVLAA